MGQYWRSIEKKECPMSKCCYDASCRAVFEYWKFANSEQWKKMIQEELEKETKRGLNHE